MIAVIDYGMGNLRSVVRGLGAAGAEVLLTDSAPEVSSASAVVLPGVGAYGMGASNLETLGLVPAIKTAVEAGKPFLGICLGMQLLFEESEESGGCRGLGILSGRVERFRGRVKVPHVGWNTVNYRGGGKLFEGIPDGSRFYFVHSYYAVPAERGIISAFTVHGTEFASALEHGNIFATQFHPEKSHTGGLKILESFCRLSERGEAATR